MEVTGRCVHAMQVPMEAEEGSRVPYSPRLTGSCVLPDVSAGNGTQGPLQDQCVLLTAELFP